MKTQRKVIQALRGELMPLVKDIQTILRSRENHAAPQTQV